MGPANRNAPLRRPPRARALRWQAYREVIAVLGAALDTRDVTTHAHAARVAGYARLLGKQLGLSRSALRALEWGSFLHDIGKIGVPDQILCKPGPLNDAEWRIMRRHPELGYRLVRRVSFLRAAAPIVLAHHERYDGNGYPRGLRGDAIPIGARIFAVADALDALTADRPYRAGISFARALDLIREAGGTQFDPVIVEICLGIAPERWFRIRAQLEAIARANTADHLDDLDDLSDGAIRGYTGFS